MCSTFQFGCMRRDLKFEIFVEKCRPLAEICLNSVFNVLTSREFATLQTIGFSLCTISDHIIEYVQ